MSGSETLVTTVAALLAATTNGEVKTIIVGADLENVPSLTLAPGQSLRGASERYTLSFTEGVDGVQLSADNRVLDITLETSPTRCAICNDVHRPSLGTLKLRHVVTTGRVQILARDQVRHGRIEVDGLDIVAADARAEPDRPQGYGVSVIQGAFTLWNMQPDDRVEISANLVRISVGRLGHPVLGSGVLVGGAGPKGGRVHVQHLETNAVYSNGMIATGTADQITGGVFTVFGTQVDSVVNQGAVTTYGANDMALDNWGTVERWTAEGAVTTYGPSAIGFVNFGTLKTLSIHAPIETHGPGARGFNVYGGTVDLGDFDRIVTHGDGAVGVQISQPIGRLVIRRGIETFGGTGPSLVKGVLQNLSAMALSVKPGGLARSIDIAGGVTTHGRGIAPIEIDGQIDALHVEGSMRTDADAPLP